MPGRLDGSSCIPPLPFPARAADSGVCCADQAVCPWCGWSIAGDNGTHSSETKLSSFFYKLQLTETEPTADLIQGLLQMRCPHALRHVSVGRVGEKELPLCSQSSADVLSPINVFLATIHHTNVACTTQRGELAQPKQMSDGADLFVQSTPLRSGKSLFSKMSFASVPSSIRSSFVMTPMVRTPKQVTDFQHIKKSLAHPGSRVCVHKNNDKMLKHNSSSG